MGHINFGSIGQFREVVNSINRIAEFDGLDSDGNPIYNKAALRPIVVVTASEKIHGTNAAIAYNHTLGFWVQSRENVITTENDNAGCAFAAYANKDHWINIATQLADEYEIDLHKNVVVVYFEWCGGNIQAKSAVSGLGKRAIIFQHFKVASIYEDTDNVWYETKGIDLPEANIFNIMNFPTYEIEINFNEPALSQNKLIALVDRIEANSRVGQQFGIDGNIGEGIVCTFTYNDTVFRFKVKGEKHANSKVKTLKPVDDVVEQAKIDFANYATPAWRLEQARDKVFSDGLDIKLTGEFLKAVVADVMKEELDVMHERGLEPKQVNGMISTIARRWLMEQI